MKKLYLIFFIIAALGFSNNSFAQAPSSDANAQQKILKFYPNPATSNINFDFTRNYSNTYTLTIINFMGKKILLQKNIPSRLNINLDGFYRGIYIFQLIDKNGIVVETGKFQVVK